MKRFERLRAELREKVEKRKLVVAPGAYDALTARVVEKAGFEAVYMTGHGTGAGMFAEVIKVEEIGEGDPSRYLAGPKIQDTSAYFLIVNRNKKSIAVNLRDERGKQEASQAAIMAASPPPMINRSIANLSMPGRF